MPYIQPEARLRLSATGTPETAGELNFIIMTLCLNFIRRKGMSYDVLNAVHGVLTCVGLELYRRVTVPYENTKIKENGDLS